MTEMKDAVAEATPSKTSYFSRILDQLRAFGLPIPAALASPGPAPFALSTRDDLPRWAAARGYDEAALKMLQRAIAATTRSPPYQKALASDLSVRFSLDGEAVEYVDPADRLTAALTVHARALKESAVAPAKNLEDHPKHSTLRLARCLRWRSNGGALR
jgi:hypothetical protein